jgi:hypothetical protein
MWFSKKRIKSCGIISLIFGFLFSVVARDANSNQHIIRHRYSYGNSRSLPFIGGVGAGYNGSGATSGKSEATFF